MESGCLNTTSLDARDLYSEMSIINPIVDRDQQKAHILSGIGADEVSHIRENALILLRQGDIVNARREYIANTGYSIEYITDALTYVSYSTYLDPKCVIHANIVGGFQAGRPITSIKSLDLMPPEDVISLSQISTKYVYYISRDIDFTNKIIYVDNVCDKHVPIMRIFRNESEGNFSYATVIDGEALHMKITGRPAVIASSSKPLKDLESQISNRFLPIEVNRPLKELRKKVHAKIRQNIGKRAIRASTWQDEEKLIIQEASRILRDNGIKDVINPFDAEEPEGSGNRYPAQFSRLIVISAFIHQFKRPILQTGDKRFILAIKEDLENASDIWHELDLAGGR
jgi:hypothetical protein